MWPKYIGNYIIEMFVAQVMNVGITFPTQNQAGIYVPTFNTKKNGGCPGIHNYYTQI